MTKQSQSKQTSDPNASFIKAQAGEIVFVAADGAVLDRATLAACYTAYSCHAELLAALKALQGWHDHHQAFLESEAESAAARDEFPDSAKIEERLWTEARAAIAKAEGR